MGEEEDEYPGKATAAIKPIVKRNKETLGWPASCRHSVASREEASVDLTRTYEI